MADKTQFRTIETDEEELNTKIRKHRLKIIKNHIVVAGAGGCCGIGDFLFSEIAEI